MHDAVGSSKKEIVFTIIEVRRRRSALENRNKVRTLAKSSVEGNICLIDVQIIKLRIFNRTLFPLLTSDYID